MYQTINFHRFQDAFTNMGREKQFSYEAQKALFDYLEDLEESMEEKFELDVIALCCEYAEIEEDDREYSQYVGDNADCEDDIIATLPLSVLVRVS